MPTKSNSKAANAFRRRLAAWYRRHGRDLPWRRTRDPYAILVSEFMLQQTQVSRVLDFWPRFLRRYPTLARLARARPKAVREAWEGLGYYRRAENLHALAKVVVREMDGALPSDPEALEKLPGVGHYTAGAVACFAYERPAATVDTNVARVLSRFFGHTGTTRLIALHRDLQPKSGKAAYVLNQAIMELGALVCTARAPKCGTCPVSGGCRYLRQASARRRTARPGS